ncbi:hypothetical protein SBDP1_1290012 [Syntrophobacter sp. SbD1]|nr:hypothetical protein SBDP1_1290012 [Syntrophobacter sp. SbD1]
MIIFSVHPETPDVTLTVSNLVMSNYYENLTRIAV